jgi:hypothetical protein
MIHSVLFTAQNSKEIDKFDCDKIIAYRLTFMFNPREITQSAGYLHSWPLIVIQLMFP